MQYFFYIKHILLSNIPDFKKKSCILSFVVGKRRLSGIIHLLCLPSVYSYHIKLSIYPKLQYFKVIRFCLISISYMAYNFIFTHSPIFPTINKVLNSKVFIYSPFAHQTSQFKYTISSLTFQPIFRMFLLPY